MPSINLFRLKVIQAVQGSLFDTGISRDEFITELILSKPSEELREGYVWHIGNVDRINDDGLMFAAGRTTKKSKELFDEDSGNFIQVDDEESPFTHAYFDRRYSLLGIEPKSKLSPTAKGISKSLEKLFNQHKMVIDFGVKIEISEIWDPEDFLRQIRGAYAVVGFTVEFSKPNPFDVEKDFHLPMERYIAATDGESGKTTVNGVELDKDNIEKLTRSVASTGNDASARIRNEEGHRPVTKHLKGDPVSITIEEVEREEGNKIVQLIRDAYSKLRKREKE